MQKSGVVLFRGIFELPCVDRRGKNSQFLNFEVHGLQYIRMAKKGPYECIAVRAPRRLGLRYIRTAKKGPCECIAIRAFEMLGLRYICTAGKGEKQKAARKLQDGSSTASMRSMRGLLFPRELREFNAQRRPPKSGQSHSQTIA